MQTPPPPPSPNYKKEIGSNEEKTKDALRN